MKRFAIFVAAACITINADVGDPQIATDHPYYPGELALSTFDRLFSTQADQFRRVTGELPQTDEQKALASWFFRNTHYAHGEEGAEDLWGAGFNKGGDSRNREYWTGLFAHGFALCGTTHSQWTAEMEYLLGHGRGRGVGVEGHNSFEVFLRGGPYGEGRWALLDHDLSTVIFDSSGKRLLSIGEVQPDFKRLLDRAHNPQKQNGWLVCGLHPGDGAAFAKYEVAEYLAGYAGPPPIVHLRRGETFRRYSEPGLVDGKTFVFWGRNYNIGGIPGPERSITWVNQPEKMFGSKEGAGHREGQARFANAVYTYKPDFASGDYREGAIEDKPDRVTFEFYTPYIIAATPPNSKDWGIYDSGAKNGLIVRGGGAIPVEVSVDQGATWQSGGRLDSALDLTDFVKGRRQYWLRFAAGAKQLAHAAIEMQTVCQAAVSVLPRLKDDGATVRFQQFGRAVVSAGPNLSQARRHIVAGAFGSPQVTLEIASPRGEPAAEVHAAAHVASGNPPTSDIKYLIDYSTDGGSTWKPVVKDWNVPRQGEEPKDFWSQSMCYGSLKVEDANKVLVRFRNSGGRNYLRAEAHLVYRTRSIDRTKVTFNWMDSAGAHTESRVMDDQPWRLATAKSVKTRWIEMQPAPR